MKVTNLAFMHNATTGDKNLKRSCIKMMKFVNDYI